eukprot:2622121-Rhodomonas_salina.2
MMIPETACSIRYLRLRVRARLSVTTKGQPLASFLRPGAPTHSPGAGHGHLGHPGARTRDQTLNTQADSEVSEPTVTQAFESFEKLRVSGWLPVAAAAAVPAPAPSVIMMMMIMACQLPPTCHPLLLLAVPSSCFLASAALSGVTARVTVSESPTWQPEPRPPRTPHPTQAVLSLGLADSASLRCKLRKTRSLIFSTSYSASAAVAAKLRNKTPPEPEEVTVVLVAEEPQLPEEVAKVASVPLLLVRVVLASATVTGRSDGRTRDEA